MNQLATNGHTHGDIMERVIAEGDLSRLTPEERSRYYATVCESLGLNPLTQPFAYIRLNGKLTLYARKDATDQLRKINGVSISKPTVTYDDGLVIVAVEARDAQGRTDADVGVVNLGNQRGDARANGIMKAITKAKRRVTLSICGLGFLDETEIETIADAEPFEEELHIAIAAPVDEQSAFKPQPYIDRINELRAQIITLDPNHLFVVKDEAMTRLGKEALTSLGKSTAAKLEELQAKADQQMQQIDEMFPVDQQPKF